MYSEMRIFVSCGARTVISTVSIEVAAALSVTVRTNSRSALALGAVNVVVTAAAFARVTVVPLVCAQRYVEILSLGSVLPEPSKVTVTSTKTS
jgi:hypothetical protein